jgi:hypothetical protein
METFIESIRSFNIPYNLKDKKENIIIIPNGVIKIKNYLTIKNDYDIKMFIKQIETLLKKYYLPIYILMENTNDTYEHFLNIVNNNIDTTRVLICNNTQQIIVGEFCYAIRTTGAIWTLVTLFDYYFPIIQNKIIYTTIETYKRAIVIMNDNEIELLHKFSICPIENININTSISISISIIYITQDTFRERELFTLKMDYVPLNGGNRSPCRIVEGVTINCPNCNNIVYYNNETIRKHNCIT